MKMLFCVLMMVLTLVSLAACGGKNEANSQTPSPPGSQSRLTEKQPASEPDRIDIDLTEFSSNMVYAEVYHMISSPEQYLGKTIKIHPDGDGAAAEFGCGAGFPALRKGENE